MPVLFAVTLFISALLLFLVQPTVGKLVLPYVGGSSAVWNTCMVFFQALLLGGYWYAHKLTGIKDQKRQVTIHLSVFAIAVAVLAAAHFLTPDGSAMPLLKSLAPRGDAVPFFPLILMLTVAVGVPFFVVSTSAPLLQRWFTATGHPASRDPYFLYAASNAGSLLSLLGYLLFVEPYFRLAEQSWLFAVGFAVLAAVVVVCGRATLNPVRPPTQAPAQAARAADAPTGRREAKWVLLGFVPSSLMLGITTKMTQDVGSFPLLWLIPLALYLVTFIIAFGKMPSWFRLVLVNLTPVVTLLLVFIETSGVKLSDGGHFALHIANFFLLSLLMHGELAHDRPNPKYLTRFFLLMSFGGVLGGLFNALLAPLVFPQLYEYHIAIVVGCLLIPASAALIGRDDATKPAEPKKPLTPEEEKKERESELLSRVLDFLFPIAMLAVVGWLSWAREWPRFLAATGWVADALTNASRAIGWSLSVQKETVMQFAVYAPPCMLCFLFIDRPLRFGLCVLALLAFHHYREIDRTGMSTTTRTFYGIIRTDTGEESHDQFYMPTPVKKTVTDEGTVVSEPLAKTEYGLSPKVRSLSHGTTLHGRQFVEDFHLPLLRDDVRLLGVNSGWDLLLLTGSQLAYDFTKEPLTYYHRTGPVGDIMREGFRRKKTPRVGMVGLGTGSAAAYAVAGQKMTFFEIDRAVKDMIDTGDHLNRKILADLTKRQKDYENALRTINASDLRSKAAEDAAARKVEQDVRDFTALLSGESLRILKTGGKIDDVIAALEKVNGPLNAEARKMIVPANRAFTYVTDARKRGAEVDIILGDARLTLEEQTETKFDLLLIDAFSSDSIPTHLLTVEAVTMYRDRLADGGLLAMHVSNRYLRLEPVVKAIADRIGMACRLFADENDSAPGKTASSWIVLARTEADLGPAFQKPSSPVGTTVKDSDPLALTWRPILADPQIPAWTDDFMDVMRVTRFPELLAVRRWVGLPVPVKAWEAKSRFVDRQYRKPQTERLYGLDSLTPDMTAVGVELDRVLERKRKLREDELRKPVEEQRFGVSAVNRDGGSEALDDEIERLEAEDAKAKKGK